MHRPLCPPCWLLLSLAPLVVFVLACPVAAQEGAPAGDGVQARVQLRFVGELRDLYSDAVNWSEPGLPWSAWSTPPPQRLRAALLTSEGESPPTEVTLILRGYAAAPRVQVVSPGSTVLLSNQDPVTYHLQMDGRDTVAPMELEGANAQERVVLSRPGRYALRDANYPFLKAYVIVAPRIAEAGAVADGPGRVAFPLGVVPRGTYTLRIYLDDRPVYERELSIQPDTPLEFLLDAEELRRPRG